MCRGIRDNQRAVAATLEAFGKLDTFVGNAAVFDYFTRLDRIAPQDFEAAFQKLFATNVQGYLLGAQASIDALRQTRGSMIFTLSNSAFMPAAVAFSTSPPSMRWWA
jgi:NAD(P)-dependent dehydrogenase (short-subunit alcohol dehydrogenase family)